MENAPLNDVRQANHSRMSRRGTCTYGTPGLDALEIVSLVGSTFQMISDWFSALLPFFIIKNLVMARRTKTGLVCILGMGIMASIAALARMLFYKYWNKTEHPHGYLCKSSNFVFTHNHYIRYS